MIIIVGIISLLLGCGIIIYDIKDYQSGDKDIYGGRIKLFGAAIILMLLGFVLILRNS
jgi:hypothetical protein